MFDPRHATGSRETSSEDEPIGAVLPSHAPHRTA
jgi:hypothetical protein